MGPGLDPGGGEETRGISGYLTDIVGGSGGLVLWDLLIVGGLKLGVCGLGYRD